MTPVESADRITGTIRKSIMIHNKFHLFMKPHDLLISLIMRCVQFFTSTAMIDFPYEWIQCALSIFTTNDQKNERNKLT